MPLGVRRVETPGGIRLVPGLPPTRPDEQDVTLADVHVLRLRRVLEIVHGDPVIDGERVGALVPGDVEQDTAPNHELDARRVTVLGASGLRRRHVVEEGVLPVDVRKGVQMRAGVVVHDGEAGRALIALRIEVS